ncbi:MAG: SEC10/PgrA surface exclusion domain-containing protein [Streptococcus sp.]
MKRQQLLLQPLKQTKKKQNLQQLQQLMFVKNSQCHKSMLMPLRFMSLKQRQRAEIAQAEQVLKNVNKRDRGNNSYQDNEADKNVKISDLNNLSEAQITDLSLYASSLINQIRTAFGTTQTSVSKGSVLAS